jgi:hypothetical protein
VDPMFRVLPESFTEADIIAFVKSHNLRRRDLTSAQRVAVFLERLAPPAPSIPMKGGSKGLGRCRRPATPLDRPAPGPAPEADDRPGRGIARPFALGAARLSECAVHARSACAAGVYRALLQAPCIRICSRAAADRAGAA